MISQFVEELQRFGDFSGGAELILPDCKRAGYCFCGRHRNQAGFPVFDKAEKAFDPERTLLCGNRESFQLGYAPRSKPAPGLSHCGKVITCDPAVGGKAACGGFPGAGWAAEDIGLVLPDNAGAVYHQAVAGKDKMGKDLCQEIDKNGACIPVVYDNVSPAGTRVKCPVIFALAGDSRVAAEDVTDTFRSLGRVNVNNGGNGARTAGVGEGEFVAWQIRRMENELQDKAGGFYVLAVCSLSHNGVPIMLRSRNDRNQKIGSLLFRACANGNLRLCQVFIQEHRAFRR